VQAALTTFACGVLSSKVTATFAHEDLSIAPIYNLIKHLISSDQTFVTSSFCETAVEWAFGVLIVLALGNLLSILIVRPVFLENYGMAGQSFKETLDGKLWIFGKEKLPTFQPKLIHKRDRPYGDCVYYSVDSRGKMTASTMCKRPCISTEASATFNIVPTVVILAVSCGECMRFQR